MLTIRAELYVWSNVPVEGLTADAVLIAQVGNRFAGLFDHIPPLSVPQDTVPTARHHRRVASGQGADVSSCTIPRAVVLDATVIVPCASPSRSPTILLHVYHQYRGKLR